MVDFGQVRDLDVRALSTFAERWRTIAGKLQDAGREFDEQVGKPLGEEKWKGEAATAARNRVKEIDREIGAVAKQAAAVAAYVEKVLVGDAENDSLTELRRRAHELVDAASARGARISDGGEVSGPGDVGELEKEVKKVVDRATEADEFIANGLRVVFGTEDNFDSESRIFGSDRDEAGMGDDVTKLKMQGVEAMMRHHYEWTDAADLLQHWLDGSGKPYEVNAQKMLDDMPNFQKDVNEDLAEVKKGEDGSFATSWSDSKPNPDDGPKNLNWYYALNHFEYRLVGEKHGDQVDYRVEVRKEYDWGTPSEHRSNVEKGPIEMEQADIAHLHSAGMARDFHVHGKTGQLRG
ncbi:hypothetical protein E1181_11540 [Saccharopolyspora terrae]|uniref:Uncharacterized protein n=1 Tax=Saccharopolyspora terrae TaxID=2530384 RepID=A0A4R4VM76_9PSEU|nr:hypothetical protein [Saccharopolyspora terrae]TDD06918.1 hypothetical protein E1181_11540 [Saccharopolyspora terrae]